MKRQRSVCHLTFHILVNQTTAKKRKRQTATTQIKPRKYTMKRKYATGEKSKNPETRPTRYSELRCQAIVYNNLQPSALFSLLLSRRWCSFAQDVVKGPTSTDIPPFSIYHLCDSADKMISWSVQWFHTLSHSYSSACLVLLLITTVSSHKQHSLFSDSLAFTILCCEDCKLTRARISFLHFCDTSFSSRCQINVYRNIWEPLFPSYDFLYWFKVYTWRVKTSIVFPCSYSSVGAILRFEASKAT